MKYFQDEKPLLNQPFQSGLSEKFIPDEFFTDNNEQPEKKPTDTKGLKEGIHLFRQKKWDESLRKLLLVNAEGFSAAQQSELAYYLGLCCAKLNRDDAPLYLEQVIANGSDMLRVYQCRMTLAYIYIKTNRIRMAENELKRLRSSGFESAQLYNTLGYSSYMQKRYRDAVDLYDKALDFDKDNATALNCMGFILADTGMDKMKGLRLCRRAVEQNPHNPAYLDSLGWAYYKNGEMTEARSLLRRALELAPQEEEIKEHFRIASKGVL